MKHQPKYKAQYYSALADKLPASALLTAAVHINKISNQRWVTSKFSLCSQCFGSLPVAVIQILKAAFYRNLSKITCGNIFLTIIPNDM